MMHGIAHGGCTDTVRESALEADSRRKIPCLTGDSNPRRYCTRTLYPQSYTRPTLGVRGAALRLGGEGGEEGGGGGMTNKQKLHPVQYAAEFQSNTKPV